MFRRADTPGTANELCHQLGENFLGVDAQSACQVDELNDIDAPLPAFDPGNDRLRGLKAAGDLSLRESGGFSGRAQGRA